MGPLSGPRPSWRAVAAWAFLVLLAMEVALDRVAVGRLPLLAPVVLGLPAAVVLAGPSLAARVAARLLRPLGRWSLGLRYLLLLTLILALVLAYALSTWRASTYRQALLEEARVRFPVTVVGDVSPERVEEVLVELESQAAVLRARWYAGDGAGPPVPVRIYRDGRSLRAGAGLPPWAGARTVCAETGAVIYLSADMGPGPLEFITSATTPGHEAVHAVTCHLWGPETTSRVPPWYREGMAEYETLRGMGRTFERAFVRLFLWFDRGRLPPAEDFCSLRPRALLQDPGLFYAAAYQFTRRLARDHGQGVVVELPRLVAEGIPFSEALGLVTGEDCPALYDDWRSSL